MPSAQGPKKSNQVNTLSKSQQLDQSDQKLNNFNIDLTDLINNILEGVGVNLPNLGNTEISGNIVISEDIHTNNLVVNNSIIF